MIYYPKNYGVCMGANKAINLAFELKRKYKDKNIYIYKEVLHNEYIINMLIKNGIKTTDTLDNLSKNDILIIRAHGESKNTYDILNKKGIIYYDATCVNVSKIHDLVIDKYNNGYKIIIVGKKDHPEVIGTNGWVDNTSIIIENKDDYKILSKNDKYYLVAQTTTNEELFLNLIDYMNKNKYNFEYKNTICYNQKSIQISSIELARKMDYMFVIGGKNSSNTRELYNLCSKVCKTYYFSDISEYYDFIKKQKFSEKTKIGFTGGASTSKEQIYEFSRLLEFIIYYKKSKHNIEKEMIRFNASIKNDDSLIINDALNKFKYANEGGKCVRGMLINLGYNLHKSDNKSIYLSSAYEAFETSILIHDDIIDNGDLRRGKKTTHKLYEEDFKNYELDNTHTSLALCIGDYGFYFINKYLLDKYKGNKNLHKLLTYYNQIAIDTIKGEILDVYLPYIEKNDKNHILIEDDILKIYRLKTSKYTIVGPFILGLILSGASKKEIELFERILEPIGISFQIKDDILGIFSTANTIGKPVISDIEEFKQTILYSYIKIHNKKYLNDLLKYYGKTISENDLLKVQNIFIESGALKYAEDLMDKLFDESKRKIDELKIKQDVKDILLGLITFLRIRKK